MLVHAVRALSVSRAVDIVVVAAPEEAVESVTAMLAENSFPADVIVVTGGDTRQDSVARALIALPDDVDVVLVHDAARPLVPEELVTAVVAAVRGGHPAVVPGLPVVDTIKEIDDQGTVVATVDRSVLRAIQTPQGFARSVLQRAHAAADLDQVPVTDDAGLVERLGIPVHVVPGHEEAFKVTRPFDVVMAEAVLARRRAAECRLTPVVPFIGIGTDVHAFAEGAFQPVAGRDPVAWRGRAGRALDADVASHALCDAILSAAGLGDLGLVFGTSDPAWSEASGVSLLAHTASLVRAGDFRIVNASVQVIGDRPGVGRVDQEAQDIFGGTIGAPVRVSGTTTDGLGLTGRGEGVAAIAVASVVPTSL